MAVKSKAWLITFTLVDQGLDDPEQLVAEQYLSHADIRSSIIEGFLNTPGLKVKDLVITAQ